MADREMLHRCCAKIARSAPRATAGPADQRRNGFPASRCSPIAFPSIDGDTLLVGAGATGFFKKPQFQLIAYSLP